MKGLCVAAVVATTVSWSGVGWSVPDEGAPAEGAAAEGAAAEGAPSSKAVAFALYERATSALQAGDFDAAARDYARADTVSPTPAALEAALLAVLKTDDAALGMTLASRAAREPIDEDLADLARQARERFGDGAGQLVVICDGCDATVDGQPIEPGVATWLRLGEHRIATSIDGRTEEQRVTVVADSVTSLRPPTGPAPEPERSALDFHEPGGRDGVSPAFFWVGLGVTLAAGAGTIASFVDLRNVHRDFERAPNAVIADEGNAAQLRTRVLLGVTGGLAVATALVGALAVDWGSEGEPMSLIIDGRGVALRSRW